MYDKQFREKNDASVPFFADWEQNPMVGKSKPGGQVPCFLTHGFLVEHMSGRMLTLKERYAVHGWNTLLSETSPFYSGILGRIQAAGCETQAKVFIGNSMHIPSIMAVIMCTLGHTTPRSLLNSAAWRVARLSSWNLEVSASAPEPAEEDASDPSFKQKRACETGSNDVHWKRMKSNIFDED